MTFPLGSDFSCVTDLDANMTQVSGRLALAQSVARRYITPTGNWFPNPDYGDDLRRFVSESGRTEMQAGAAAEAEAEKDERVDRADVNATGGDQRIDLEVRLTDGDGPFDLTIGVGELTVELLSQPGEF